MTITTRFSCLISLAVLVAWTSGAAITQTASSNLTGDATGLAEDASSADLIQGLAPIISPTPFFDQVYGGAAPDRPSGLTDGIATATSGSSEDGVYMPETFGGGGHLPFTFTFMLDTAHSPFGYDLTKINTFAGWWGNGRTLANQKFELQVRQVGGSDYLSLGTFEYLPFTAADDVGPSASLLSLTASGGGALATHVDSVRFVFQATGVAAPNSVDGLVVKEADVFGHPSGLLQTNSSNTTGDMAGLTDTGSSGDLLQGLVPTVSPAPLFDMINGSDAPAGQSSLTDGEATATAAGNGMYLPATFGSSGHLPFTVTFMLNTAAAPGGYNLTKINSFAGWNGNGFTLANQKFELFVRPAGGTDYVPLGTYESTPFTAADGAGMSSSLLSLTAPGGPIAICVDSVRFVFHATGVPDYNFIDGYVIKEMDVFGEPSPSLLTLVQSNSSNLTGDTAGLAAPASASDLLQGLAPSYSVAPLFDQINGVPGSLSGLADGNATTTVNGSGTGAYLPETFVANTLPCTVTFTLNTNVAPFGYDLTGINSFAGWDENGRTLANQKFDLLVRQAGSANYVWLGTYQYLPFTAADGTGPSSSMVSLAGAGGAFIQRVDSVRFIFQSAGVAAPNAIDGCVIKELDVFGHPSTLVQTSTSNTTGDTAGLSDVASDLDLLQGLAPTYAPNPFFDFINGASAPAGQSGLTDGSATATSGANANGAYLPETFAGGVLPCTVTFLLNTNVAPFGYDITAIHSFAGWHGNGLTLANQKYDLLVRPTGGTEYVPLGTFSAIPFTSAAEAGLSSSLLSLAGTHGAFIRGVDAIRFVFRPTGLAAFNGIDGYVIKELDVFGHPSTVVQTSSRNTTGDAAWLTDEASATDLLEGLAPAYAPNPFFDFINGAAAPAGRSGLTDGSATVISAASADGAYLPETFAGGVLPCTVTFLLNTALAPAGYDITKINSFAGWDSNGRTLANQNYDLLVRLAGGTAYVPVGRFSTIPFTSATEAGRSSSLLSLAGASGAFIKGVDSLRFIFRPTGLAAYGGIDGYVIKELDVFGVPSEFSGATLTLTSPKVRQIVQRGAANTADVTISGALAGAAGVQRLEARAVVMDGAPNNGTSTDWVTISTASSGAFSGVLPAVAAGGWYRIEVRAVDGGGSELAAASVERVGVGDIFVTAGQSNAACYGNPPQQPGDDRVSAWWVAGNSWQWAADPQPNPSGSPGGGGSPWPILGTLLAQSNGVPVGFVAVAWGGSGVSLWQPGNAAYVHLTNALRALGLNGARAVLWHQGETDAVDGTSAASYAQMLSNTVARSRTDAGWVVPWGIAEASFHPSATRAAEEPVAAGQRLLTYSTTRCFRGPRTDDFNLEGKLSDSVHFNAAGLEDHARQWADAINGADDLTVKNGDFEANPPLADGAADDATRVIGWNRLDEAGAALAGGSNGYFNPDAGAYPGSADTLNGGVLPNMDGRHAGALSGGAASNAFLQTLRARLQPNTAYTLRVALGVRDNAELFGGSRLDLLINGVPLGTGTEVNLAMLNALAGGSAAGKFTVVSYTFTSTAPVAANQQLAVRITKPGGAGTYLDFDDVQVTGTPVPPNPPFITASRSGADLLMSVPSQIGYTYVLEAATSLSTPSWLGVATNSGTGGALGFSAPLDPAQPQRYFRVRAY